MIEKIGDIPKVNSVRYPNKEAIIYDVVRLKWKEVNVRVNKLANALLEIGLEKGDRVAILDENSNCYLELYFALAKSGIIAVPLNYRLSPYEILNLVKHSEPKILFVGEDYCRVAELLRAKINFVKHYVCIGKSFPKWMTDYQDFMERHADTEPKVIVDRDDIFAIMYTSGTTGLPKGAESTHFNYIMNGLNVLWATRAHPNDKNLVAAPLYHAGALFHSIAFLMLGCTHVILKRYRPEAVLEAIDKEKITVTLLVPTMINWVINHPNISEYNLKSLRNIFYGGGIMPTEVLRKAVTTLKCGFTQGYGLTETLESNFLLPEDHVLDGSEKQQERLKSAGTIAPNFMVKIVNERGDEVPKGKVGEIWIKGPSVCKGLWKNPDETRRVLIDGWFNSEDLGRIDEDGYLWVVDRKKDAIKTGAEYVFSKEVEDIIHEHPAVLEAAVIGTPDEVWGEAVKAFIVPKPGMKITKDDIIEWCKQRLASYKKPKYVEFVDELPKSASGKILKRVLREKEKSSS